MFYVYKHVHPKTGVLLYVGYGQGERAWRTGQARSRIRNKDHSIELDRLLSEGYLPSDWVEVVHRGLEQKEAYNLEQQMIKELKPRYNVDQQEIQTKLTKEQFDEMKSLRASGATYKSVASKVGVSTMTAWYHLNNKSVFARGL